MNVSSKLAIRELTYRFNGSACESLEAIEYGKNLNLNTTEPIDKEGIACLSLNDIHEETYSIDQ